MKRNVVLSTVAATVVTGVLMMSGCTSSKAKQADQSYSDVGSVKVVVSNDGTTDSTATTDGKVEATVVVRGVSSCVDSEGAEAPCEEVCTTTTPCEVTIEAACGPDAKLNYGNETDFVGAFDAWRDTNNADVLEIISKTDGAGATLVTAFSGSASISQTGGIDICDFDFSTFIVCALTEVKKLPYYNTSDNSAGYVMVLVEYNDGTKEWKKVVITRKSNGEENDQPFIKITGLNGKMPVKFSVFSILEVGKPATGSSGSTGTIGAGD